jgi:beta-N-acetylhexosaminidase
MSAAGSRASGAVIVAVALAAMALAPALAQGQRSPDARTLLARMTPAQRVGQLFLVPFWGDTAPDGSAVAALVSDRHVGGVLLDPARGDFTNTVGAPLQVARLTRALQARATGGDSGVPLLVAVSQLGDPYPDSALWGGMTPLPSSLALGATWQPDLAEAVGEVAGRELAAAGVNLLLGPVLDVADDPRPASSGDLGVRTFGGSAPWVARFGQRYVAGVHRGSGGRVATAVTSFPGIGGADRSPAEDLPVVEGTLPDLATADLVPFAAVTGVARREAGRTDAMVTSNVRYRGVQQQADRPISLDSGGLRYLWAQVPQLTAWREDQGVLVSPALGAPAVRRYLDPTLGTFNARRVAREALMAGHDLLTLSDLAAPEDPDAQTAIMADVIDWLAREYEQDDAVRDAVDAAALRVLSLKQRIGLLDTPVGPEPQPETFGGGLDLTAQVARQALTQIAPVDDHGGWAAAESPRTGNRIAFIVDARVVRECATCAPYQSLDPERFLAAVRRAYGPAGTGRLVRDDDATAITFAELKAWLQASGRVRPEDTVALVPPLRASRLAEVGRQLRRADWLVFGMRDVRPQDDPASDALKLFLKADPPELAAKRRVALAFGAPYYLDATEIARLTAYYALYSRSEAFVDVAVRALYGDQVAVGASPVTVTGARYDLARRLEPSLDQIPELELVGHDPAVPMGQGATVTVRTTTVRDDNGHPVPDGTPVRIRRYDRAEGVFLPDVDAVTTDGRATVSMRLDRPGVLEISAAFENGLRGKMLAITVEEAGLFFVRSPDFGPLRPGVAVDWGIFVLSLGLMLLAGVIAYVVDGESARAPARLLRLFLISLCWGLVGYLMVAAGGLHINGLGPVRVWPSGWSVAYQAPLLAFALALVPVLAVRRHWRALVPRGVSARRQR